MPLLAGNDKIARSCRILSGVSRSHDHTFPIVGLQYAGGVYVHAYLPFAFLQCNGWVETCTYPANHELSEPRAVGAPTVRSAACCHAMHEPHVCITGLFMVRNGLKLGKRASCCMKSLTRVHSKACGEIQVPRIQSSGQYASQSDSSKEGSKFI